MEGESRVADLRAQLARSRIHRLQFRRRPAFHIGNIKPKTDCIDSSWRARLPSSGSRLSNSNSVTVNSDPQRAGAGRKSMASCKGARFPLTAELFTSPGRHL